MTENKMSENKFVTNGKTKLVQGSILTPEGSSLRFVFVPCSESGVGEDALHGLLSRKWKQAKAELKGWYSHHVNFKLGNIKDTAVQSDTWLVHCLVADKTGKVNDKALASCVKKVADLAKFERASVHVSTLVTEDMPQLLPLLQTEMIEKGITVLFYEEPVSQ